jgi:hypothetical protein
VLVADQHHASPVAAERLRKALQPRLAIPTYLFLIFDSGKAENLDIDKRPLLGAAAVRLLASTEVREGQRFMAHQFVTRCVNCAKEFGILWVMDLTRIGPRIVARITCPLCEKRFYQHAEDLIPVGPQNRNLKAGRAVRIMIAPAVASVES